MCPLGRTRGHGRRFIYPRRGDIQAVTDSDLGSRRRRGCHRRPGTGRKSCQVQPGSATGGGGHGDSGPSAVAAGNFKSGRGSSDDGCTAGPGPGPAWPAALCNSSRNEPGLQSLGTQLKPHNSKNRENNLIRSAMSRALCSILKRHIRHRDSLSEPASRAAAGPPARPGSEAAVEIVISQNVLRFVLWPVSEAAEDSQCNGCSMPPRPL